jgi:hypothetical protein
MKQFGFPQVHRGGDGGGEGGGGADGEAEDALAEALDHTDFSSNSVGLGGLANSDFSSMEVDMGIDEVGFENIDWGSYGPSQSFADTWESLGLGYNNNNPGVGIDEVGFENIDWGSYGPSSPGVDVVDWEDYNSIDAQAPNMSYSPGFASRDTPGFRSALEFPVSDWSTTPTDQSRGWGLPGPAVAAITVNPSQSPGSPGSFEHAPSYANPTQGQSFGLPAANYPGAGVSEIDWGAAAQAGLGNVVHNTFGNISAESLAQRQAQNIPYTHTSTDGYQSLMHPTRGSLAPELLSYEQQQRTPYQQTSTDGFTSWVHPQRGNISADDPEVLALLRRG